MGSSSLISNLGLLHWEHGVLATGPPGRSHNETFKERVIAIQGGMSMVMEARQGRGGGVGSLYFLFGIACEPDCSKRVKSTFKVFFFYF